MSTTSSPPTLGMSPCRPVGPSSTSTVVPHGPYCRSCTVLYCTVLCCFKRTRHCGAQGPRSSASSGFPSRFTSTVVSYDSNTAVVAFLCVACRRCFVVSSATTGERTAPVRLCSWLVASDLFCSAILPACPRGTFHRAPSLSTPVHTGREKPARVRAFFPVCSAPALFPSAFPRGIAVSRVVSFHRAGLDDEDQNRSREGCCRAKEAFRLADCGWRCLYLSHHRLSIRLENTVERWSN